MENKLSTGLKIKGEFRCSKLAKPNKVTNEGLSHVAASLISSTNYPSGVTHMMFLSNFSAVDLASITFNDVRNYIAPYSAVTVSTPTVTASPVTITYKATIAANISVPDFYTGAVLVARGNTSSSQQATYSTSGNEVVLSAVTFDPIMKDDWDTFEADWIIKLNAQ